MTRDVANADTVDAGSASTVAGTPAASPSTGDVALPPPYQFRRELSRGGMGRILIAWDTRHGREVAIKLMRDADPALLARFQREAQVTARLQHPAIVPVYDSGTLSDGEPFYVMRYVSGRSLHELVSSQPTAAARLALLPQLIAAADAIAYAHDRYVVHRDLKPQNILVGPFGETVVIDWGLAKDLVDDAATEGSRKKHLAADTPSDLTVAGTIIGTPGYMPPEQARGLDVDERADVYALGAVLYYVLAGAPPYQGSSSGEVLAALLDHPPAPLATRDRGVPADLRAIVEKAMARDPAARYRSAAALAADLKKFQTGQLVGAHDYSWLERVRRFTRRQRMAVGVGTVLFAAIVLVSMVSARRITRERDVATAQRLEAEARRAEAESVRDAADGLNGYLLAELAERLERLGRLDLLKGVGEAVVKYEESIARKEPSLRAARALELVGKAESRRGDLATAERALRRSLDLHRQVASSSRDAAAGRGLLRVEATLFDVVQRRDGATAEVRAFAARSDAFVAEAEGAARDDAARLVELAEALVVVAAVHGVTDERALGEQALRASARIAARAATLEPSSQAARLAEARARTRLAELLVRLLRLKEARDEQLRALTIAETLADEAPGDPGLQYERWLALLETSRLAASRSDLPAAKTYATEALAVGEELRKRYPDRVEYQEAWLGAIDQLGALAFDAGRYAEVRRLFEMALGYIRTLDARPGVGEQRDYFRQRAQQLLGDSLVNAGRPAEGIPLLAAAVEAEERREASRASDVKTSLILVEMRSELGYAKLRAGRHADAVLDLQKATERVERALAADPKSSVWLSSAVYGFGWLGTALARAGRRDEARVAFERALSSSTALLADPAAGEEVETKVAVCEAAAQALEALGASAPSSARPLLARALPRVLAEAAHGSLQANAAAELPKWERLARGGR